VLQSDQLKPTRRVDQFPTGEVDQFPTGASTKTDQATHFLPAPGSQNAQRPTGRPPMPLFNGPAKSEKEMVARTAAQLAAQGIDVTDRPSRLSSNDPAAPGHSVRQREADYF